MQHDGPSMDAAELPMKLLLLLLRHVAASPEATFVTTSPRGRYVNHYDDTLAQLDALGHVAPFEAKARAAPAGSP